MSLAVETTPEASPLHYRYRGEQGDGLDRLFLDNVPGLIGELSLERLLVLDRTQHEPPDVSDYQLVPVMPASMRDESVRSLTRAGCLARPPRHVRIPPRLVDNEPILFQDAWIALGLVYKDVIRAICAAGIDEESGLLGIRQIQGYQRRKSEQENASLGLWGGFRWRPTLVRGWIDIAEQFDSITGVEILSYANVGWATNDWLRMRIRLAHDNVARKMLFHRDPGTKNWTTPVASQTRHSLCDAAVT